MIRLDLELFAPDEGIDFTLFWVFSTNAVLDGLILGYLKA